MIRYLQRTREYYAAQGYKPYQWAHFDDTPFQPPRRPVSEGRLVLITTAAPHRPKVALQPDTGPHARYNAEAKFWRVYQTPLSPRPDLRISHIGYDRKHCDATDSRTWLPIDALLQAQRNGSVGEVAAELIGVPTNRSQRTTQEQDAPDTLAAAQRLGADLALLVPS